MQDKKALLVGFGGTMAVLGLILALVKKSKPEQSNDAGSQSSEILPLTPEQKKAADEKEILRKAMQEAGRKGGKKSGETRRAKSHDKED